jgi:hypothetical protein
MICLFVFGGSAQKSRKPYDAISFARWLVDYARTYGVEVPNYTFHDWMEVADLMLQKEYDYLDERKPLAQLNALLRLIKDERHVWPTHADEHPLFDVFMEFFDPSICYATIICGYERLEVSYKERKTRFHYGVHSKSSRTNESLRK